MKTKVFLLLLSLLPLSVLGRDTERIQLGKDSSNGELGHRNEIGTTSFVAEILSNNIIKVQSNEITSFCVKIEEVETGTLVYAGTTPNGVLHITTNSLSAGSYIIKIEGHGFKYIGEFVIGN